MRAASLSPVVVIWVSNSRGGSAPSIDATASVIAVTTVGERVRKNSCMSCCGGFDMAKS